jgi:hypothetical protein
VKKRLAIKLDKEDSSDDTSDEENSSDEDWISRKTWSRTNPKPSPKESMKKHALIDSTELDDEDSSDDEFVPPKIRSRANLKACSKESMKKQPAIELEDEDSSDDEFVPPKIRSRANLKACSKESMKKQPAIELDDEDSSDDEFVPPKIRSRANLKACSKESMKKQPAIELEDEDSSDDEFVINTQAASISAIQVIENVARMPVHAPPYDGPPLMLNSLSNIEQQSEPVREGAGLMIGRKRGRGRGYGRREMPVSHPSVWGEDPGQVTNLLPFRMQRTFDNVGGADISF